MTYGEEKKTLERAFRKMLFYKLYNVTRPENNSRENEWSSRKILRCFPVLAISFLWLSTPSAFQHWVADSISVLSPCTIATKRLPILIE